MILWKLLFLFQAVWTVQEQAVSALHEACKKHGNELVFDKVLKLQAPDDTVTVWDIDEIIKLHEESGRIALVLSSGTSAHLSYVDESALKVSVTSPSHQSAIVEYYQNPEVCKNQNALGIRSIHLNLVNTMRNTTNELVLKYEIVCGPQEERTEDLRVSWKTDANCPALTTMPTLSYPTVAFYQFFSSPGSVEISPDPAVGTRLVLGSRITAAYFLIGNGSDYDFNVTCSNPEVIRVSKQTSSVSFTDTKYSLAIVHFETLKPGASNISVHMKGGADLVMIDGVTVLPSGGSEVSSKPMEAFEHEETNNEQAVSALHEACEKYGNELVFDKILKLQAPDDTVTVWNIDETIKLHEESGRIALVLSYGTSAHLSYVDESALKVSVTSPSIQSAIVEYYQNPGVCKDQNSLGVRNIHLNLVNMMRNTTNELVLKYEIVCSPLEERTEDLHASWKFDANCPAPTTKPTLNWPSLFFYQFFSSPEAVEISPDQAVGTRLVSGSHITAAYFFKGNVTDFDFNLTCSNPEVIRVTKQTSTLSFTKTGYSLGIVHFETLKPGTSNISLHTGGGIYYQTIDGVTVLPGFSERWNHTILRQVDLNEGDAHMIKVFVHHEAIGGRREFHVNGDMRSFDITTGLTNGTKSWLYFVVKGNKEPLSLEASSDIHPPYKTTTNQLNHHVASIPFDFPRRNIPNEIMKVKLTGSGISQEYTLNITLLSTSNQFVLEKAIYKYFGNGAELKKNATVVGAYTIGDDKTGNLEPPKKDSQGKLEVYENVTGLVVVGKKGCDGFVATLKKIDSEESKDTISVQLLQKPVEIYNFPRIIQDSVYYFDLPFHSGTFQAKPGKYVLSVLNAEAEDEGHVDLVIIKSGGRSYLHDE